jgi:hypothetical protein
VIVRALACCLAFAAVAASIARPVAALEGDYEYAVTRIAVKLTTRISSQDAKPGDRFTFDTTSSIVVDGRFLPAGTHGHGLVVAARAARGPQPGALTLEARSLDPPDGKIVEVGLAPGELATVLRGDRRSFPGPGTGAAPVPIGSRETNVVYDAGKRFTVVAPPPPTAAPDPSDSAAP